MNGMKTSVSDVLEITILWCGVFCVSGRCVLALFTCRGSPLMPIPAIREIRQTLATSCPCSDPRGRHTASGPEPTLSPNRAWEKHTVKMATSSAVSVARKKLDSPQLAL